MILSYLTWYAISYPNYRLVSSATLLANAIAANLLGYVIPILPGLLLYP